MSISKTTGLAAVLAEGVLSQQGRGVQFPFDSAVLSMRECLAAGIVNEEERTTVWAEIHRIVKEGVVPPCQVVKTPPEVVPPGPQFEGLVARLKAEAPRKRAPRKSAPPVKLVPLEIGVGDEYSVCGYTFPTLEAAQAACEKLQPFAITDEDDCVIDMRIVRTVLAS